MLLKLIAKILIFNFMQKYFHLEYEKLVTYKIEEE